MVLLFDLNISRRLTGMRFSFSMKRTLQLLRECAPLMCNSFFMSAIVSIPRSVLEAEFGEYILGIYASIATPAVIVQSAATWLYTPVLTTFTRYYVQREKKHYFALFAKIWAVIAAAIVLVLAAARLLGAWGLGLLFDQEIVSYAYLLLPVLVTTILIACSYFLGALLTIARTLKVIAISNGAATLVVALLSRPIIRAFQMDGVNYVIYIAMGLNVLVLACTLAVVLRRQFRLPPAPEA